MKWLDSTGKRLGASFGLVLALMVAVAGASWLALALNRDASDRMVNTYLPLVFDMEALHKSHLRVSVLVRDIASHSDISVQKQSIAALVEQRGAIDRSIESLRRKTAEGGIALAGMDEVIASKARTNEVIERALELIKISQYDEASSLVYNDLRPVQLAVAEQLDRMQAALVGQVAGTAQAVSERSATSVRAIAFGTAFALAVGILASLWITRSITGPLNAGLAIANQVAAGDLTAAIEVRSEDEFGRMLRALRTMNDNLTGMVRDIRSNAEAIHEAADAVMSGNADLAHRTEEQASTLEQTAASMEELTTAVQENTRSAGNASDLALKANHVAARGGAVMDSVVATMNDIRDSSTRIRDIIGVIDGIAFQTNILALNAAVEAARAGEQGRGFAVVAAEVRSLAQRSAAAAREIKALIGDSVDKVQAGTREVEDAGRTMAEIVASVEKVGANIEQIGAASREQATGIEQVNHAIAHMDTAVQQNAAVVGAAAAAAGSMQASARQLVQSVSVFKLGAEARPAPGAHSAPQARRRTDGARIAHPGRGLALPPAAEGFSQPIVENA
ncbi:MAG TPA: methyl-accepting chemotaxis protein [Usitatibacter sp.]|nr:methyl-accepting chemotaxis protein [Usitatibacter sp.]